MKNSKKSAYATAGKPKKVVKKGAAKPALQNPFATEWVAPNSKGSYKVISFLKQALEMLREEAVTSGKENQKKVKDTCNLAAKPFLLFGFNAVMKAIEKGSVKSVFVNSSAKPNVLSKSFVSVCNLKNIPLIPVEDLTNVVQETIGFKSCLVLAIKECVSANDVPWFELHRMCCEATGNQEEEKETMIDEFNKEVKPFCVEDKTIHSISQEEIQSFHLKRKSNRERIFNPPKQRSYNNILSDDMDFIAVNDRKKINVYNENSVRERKPLKGPKSNERESSSILDFVLDVEGEADLKSHVKEEHLSMEDTKEALPKEISELKDTKEALPKEIELKGKGKKRKKKSKASFSYVPAKMVRTKPNLNRS